MSDVGLRLVGRRMGEWLGLLRREAEVGEETAQGGELDEEGDRHQYDWGTAR